MPLSPEEALKQYYEKREASPVVIHHTTHSTYNEMEGEQMYLYAAEDGETIVDGGPYAFVVTPAIKPPTPGWWFAFSEPEPLHIEEKMYKLVGPATA